MNDKKPVIWVLYDDGYGSWNKRGFSNVYSLGINDNNWNNYFKVDLSTINMNLKKDLWKIAKITGKPDYIVAHPPCKSWSNADNTRRLFRGCETESITETMYIKVFTKNKITILNEQAYFRGNKHLLRDYGKQHGRFLNGLGTATAVQVIIEEFTPLAFIIENPETSTIWDYYQENGWYLFHKKTYYNNWDNSFTPKSTIFASNFIFSFPKEMYRYKPNKKTMSYSRVGSVSLSYDKKCMVPAPLVDYLYNQLLNHYEEHNRKWDKFNKNFDGV